MTPKTLAALLLCLPPPLQADDDPTKLQRAQAYFALKQTISQESDVDKLLILKNPRREIETLLRDIASLSEKHNKELESWSREDPALIAKDDGFPPIEKKTREGIGSDMAKSLLLTGGRNFEVRVLVSQIQALDYISNGLQALEDAEKSGGRKERLKSARDRYEKLVGRAYELLGAKK